MIGKDKNLYKLIPDASIFIIGSLLQYITIYLAVPILSERKVNNLCAWMILSVPMIFVPVITGGILILLSERKVQNLKERLRIRKLTKYDLKQTFFGFLGIIVGSGIAFTFCRLLKLDTNPPFARNAEAWTNGHLWMFALWALYWPVNILGENFVWRGVVLPRMERKIGKSAWLLNAFLWGLFHLAFGLGNLIILLPTLIIVPFIAQKTHNTWTAIILHACLSGPGFIALAFGLMK